MKTISKQRTQIRKSFILLTLVFLLLTLLQSCKSEEEVMVDPDDDDQSESLIDFDYLSVVSNAQLQVRTLAYYEDGSSDLRLKFFDVQNAVSMERPLIILAPGGGWSKYNRKDELEEMCRDLASRGYATALMDYTIDTDGPTAEVWLQSLKDMKVAIKYFKKNAADFEIDPDNIFVGGWSTGAQLALYATQLDVDEIQTMDQEILHLLLDDLVEAEGIEPSMYTEYSSEVKGTLLLLPYAWNEDFLDKEGSVMMIANRKSHFADDVVIWGPDFESLGIKQIGPDVMYDKFIELGYNDNDDLDFIITDPSLDTQVSHFNYTPLHESHFDDIALYFQRNLD